MRSRALFTLLFVPLLSLLLVPSAASGVWEDEFPVIQDPVYQYQHFIAVSPDDTVYILWPDWTDFENTKVNLMRSANKGKTWWGPSVIFDGAAYDNFGILADGQGLHLLLVEFWEDNEEHKELYYTRSLDQGKTFSPPARIGAKENIEQIRFFADAGNLFVYARDYAGGNPTELFYVSTDGGSTWQEKPILPGTVVQNPDFTVRNGIIHMAFGGDLANPGIRYAFSADLGDTWSPSVGVSSGAGKHSQLPSIAVDDHAIHVAWEDDRSNYFNIMYSKSTDGGATWSPDVRINDTFYGARNRLLCDGEGLHIVWCQYHGNNGWPSSWGSGDYGIVWYKFSADSGGIWTGEFRVSQNEHIPPILLPDQGANYVQLAEYHRGFCAVWRDKRDGNIDLYMRNEFKALHLGQDAATISAATGGAVSFDLAAGAEDGGKAYLLLGSVSGTAPGMPFPGGGTLPLNHDLFTQLVIAAANTPLFSNFMGTLDPAGNGAAKLDTLGPLDPAFVGIVMHFAYAASDAPFGLLASNPAEVEIVN